MASKAGQPEADKVDIEEALDSVDKTLDRTKVLYEQYFLGMQKQPPSQIHTDVERRLRELQQLSIRNTGLRYRFATLQQKFGSYNSYWRRTLKQIENGTYIRNLHKISRKAALTGEEIPEEILAAMPKRMREQVKRDREQAIAIARRRNDTDTDTNFLDDDGGAAVIGESPEVVRQIPRGGAQVLDEEDGDLDFEAFFASVEMSDDTRKNPPTYQEPAAPPSRGTGSVPSTRSPPPGPPATAAGTLPPRSSGSHQSPGATQPSTAAPGARPPPPPPPRPTGSVSAIPQRGSESVAAQRTSGPSPVLPQTVAIPTLQNVAIPTLQTGAIPPVGEGGSTPIPTQLPSGSIATQRTTQLIPAQGPFSQRTTQLLPTLPAQRPSGSMPAGPPSHRMTQPIPTVAAPRVPPSRTTGTAPAVPAPGVPAPPRMAVPNIARPLGAPSQVSKPNPVAPGSSTARPAVPVETMSGPFPRAAAPPVHSRQEPPKAAPPKPQTTSPRPPPGMNDADVNALYATYVKAKQAVGEEAGPGSYGKLLQTINAQAPKIMEQYKAKGVEFSVVVKDNQVVIKAKPKT